MGCSSVRMRMDGIPPCCAISMDSGYGVGISQRIFSLKDKPRGTHDRLPCSSTVVVRVVRPRALDCSASLLCFPPERSALELTTLRMLERRRCSSRGAIVQLVLLVAGGSSDVSGAL